MRRVVVSGLVALVATLVSVGSAGASGHSSGNGEAAKAPSRILSDATAATGATSSVLISGTERSGTSRTTMHIVSSSGGVGGGTVSKDGLTFQIVAYPPNAYLKADTATWIKVTHDRSVATLFADKWLQTASSNPDFDGFTRLVDISRLMQSLSPKGSLTKNDVMKFHGKLAIPLQDSKGQGTLYVAAEGRPVILGISGTGKHRGEEVRLTQYGSAEVPGEPADFVNLADLEEQSGLTGTNGQDSGSTA